MRNNLIVLIFVVFGGMFANAQVVDIHGEITAISDVDGIHIMNKTSSRFTISDADGTFTIPAKLNDTILFSGISYQTKEIVVTNFIIASKQMPVYLEELVNALDEVVVGKILTGDLLSDIKNAQLTPELNFYNLGIPGYTGKLKSQTERRLYEASSGGGLIPIFPIINAISGRTKRLKAQVKFEKLDDCVQRMKSKFSIDVFNNYDLEEGQKAEFFYYCQDDPQFENLCKNTNDMVVFEFLQSKLVTFMTILEAQKK